MGARKWTAAEEAYLEKAWDSKASIPAIAKKLNRSVEAVKLRRFRIGLGRKLDAGECVSYNQLVATITGARAASRYTKISWINNRQFPVRTRKVGQCSFKVVRMKDFWRWAEANKSFLDFSRFEKYALGPEPEWVDKKRQDDIASGKARRLERWTRDEDSRLRQMCESGRYTYQEIADRLHRTNGAVASRITHLGIKLWPQRHEAHEAHWTKEQYIKLRDGIIAGRPWCVLAQDIGKSEKACRGTAFRIWNSEKMDKIRQIMPQYVARFERLLNGRGRKNAAG